MHDLPLITTIASGLTAALIFGLLTQRIGLSPIVGYLFAGVIIGPNTPGLVGNAQIAQQLAELGVILLMFGVGLHFHLEDLLAVKNIAIPGAIIQSAAATLLAVVVFYVFDIPIKGSVVIGMAMSVASTVVLMRVLMDASALESPPGHLAVGWSIVQDILTVILLVLIPVMGSQASPEAATVAADAVQNAGEVAHAAASSGSVWITLAVALVKLVVLCVLILVLGARVMPWLLVRVAKLRSRELFTLTVLVFSIAIAAGAYYAFGASMALGAFLAGMVVAQSPVSHQAGAEMLPLRDAFAVLFFVSVGMLFDPWFIVEHPWMLLAGLGIILIVKPLSALLVTAVLGQSARTSLTVAIVLAQIGEFSFILAELARSNNLLPETGTSLLVACAIISITINPILYRNVPRIEDWLRGRPFLWKLINGRAENRMLEENQSAAQLIAERSRNNPKSAVVVGFGPVGRSVHRLLLDAGLPTTIIDMNMDTVSSLNASGQPAVFGDASNESILHHAGVDRASHVVLTLPGSGDRAAVLTAIRNLNGKARIWVRARYLRERQDLERSGVTAAVFEEAEAAIALARLVLADTGLHREAAEQKLRELRMHLLFENMSNFRSQRVRSVMIPWSRVQRLSSGSSLEKVLSSIASERFSRWPVQDVHSGKVASYLLTKDLIAHAANTDWQTLLRPLQSIGPDDDIESTLSRMQRDGVTILLVEDNNRILGLITLEDILEQVVGRIEDEYPHEPTISLEDALAAGGVKLNLESSTRDEAIAELADCISKDVLPEGWTSLQVAERAIAREAEYSTDLGMGVAIPHVRCPGLRAPLVVAGRSELGVTFSSESAVPPKLIFLLVTPTEVPESHLALLQQIADAVANDIRREELLKIDSPTEFARLMVKN